MRPVTFQCQLLMPKSGTEICNQITDVERWSDFDGYGFLPGIEKAEYRKKMDGVLGSIVQVQNSDGSKHVEEITQWDEGVAIAMKMYEFSVPLNKLSTHFIEDWTFTNQGNKTLVIRKFSLYPKNIFTKPFLWLISKMLKKAVQQHLVDISK